EGIEAVERTEDSFRQAPALGSAGISVAEDGKIFGKGRLAMHRNRMLPLGIGRRREAHEEKRARGRTEGPRRRLPMSSKGDHRSPCDSRLHSGAQSIMEGGVRWQRNRLYRPRFLGYHAGIRVTLMPHFAQTQPTIGPSAQGRA